MNRNKLIQISNKLQNLFTLQMAEISMVSQTLERQ